MTTPGLTREPEGFAMDYHGYEPPAGVVTKIEEVPANIEPEAFFDRYVAKRRPVLLKSSARDPKWLGNKWSNRYLKERAGSSSVIVEQRGMTKGSSFGLSAPKVTMSYGEFLEQIATGNDRLYLTTQDLERFDEDLDDMDMPLSVMAEPLKSLQEDFALHTRIAGNLIPYQLSMWQGLCRSGTSSGLHHDYHDNLYMLLRGRKRFRLFAPSAARHMRTAGKLAKVHANGLIVYRNKPHDPTVVVRSDGVPISFLLQQKKEYAEFELAEAEDSLERLDWSNGMDPESKALERRRLEEKIQQCEMVIDQVMDELLVYGCSGSEIGSDDESELGDNVVKEDGDGVVISAGDIDNDDGAPPVKRSRVGNGSEPDHNLTSQKTHTIDSPPESNNKELDKDSQRDSKKELDRDTFVQKMPDHFCDMTFPVEESDDQGSIFESLPHLKEVGCIVCELTAGDILYLPASWFHEVTSYSLKVAQGQSQEEVVKAQLSEGSESAAEVRGFEDVGHLALNYWYYPPDNDEFSQPYLSDFWPKRWQRIQEGSVPPIQKVWSDEEEEEEEGEDEF